MFRCHVHSDWIYPSCARFLDSTLPLPFRASLELGCRHGDGAGRSRGEPVREIGRPALKAKVEWQGDYQLSHWTTSAAPAPQTSEWTIYRGESRQFEPQCCRMWGTVIRCDLVQALACTGSTLVKKSTVRKIRR